MTVPISDKVKVALSMKMLEDIIRHYIIRIYQKPVHSVNIKDFQDSFNDYLKKLSDDQKFYFQVTFETTIGDRTMVERTLFGDILIIKSLECWDWEGNKVMG